MPLNYLNLGLVLTFCFVLLYDCLQAQIDVVQENFKIGTIAQSESRIDVYFFNSSNEVIDNIEQVNGEMSFKIASNLNLSPGEYAKLTLPISRSLSKIIKERILLSVNGQRELITLSLKGKRSGTKGIDQECPDFGKSKRLKSPKPAKQIKNAGNPPSISVYFVESVMPGSMKNSGKAEIQNNLVFLLDASSSMLNQRKQDFISLAFEGLGEILQPSDQITILSYSSEARVIFKTTREVNFKRLMNAIAKSSQEGVTNGSEAIRKAYVLADSTFIPKGNNTIILLTDGAFNANETDAISEKIISKYANSGIRLSIIGIDNQTWASKEMKSLCNDGKGRYISVRSNQSAKNAIKQSIKHSDKN